MNGERERLNNNLENKIDRNIQFNIKTCAKECEDWIQRERKTIYTIISFVDQTIIQNLLPLDR